ncbi:hypothetical protein LOS22_14570 [Enterococcus faecium]|uniref:Uncharacterized protein n=3 Tax=Schiekvirus TaxID=2732968 RepID=A0A8D6UBI3_9CAUD|nr:hypothetical protein [Enterococcus faecium]MCC9083662.1 hypothetical protein [Enterococcus faecium]QVW54608.1 capsid protein [Enterococcus phage 113]CAI9421175.1 Hypothetical protein PORT_96 [Enterococcus phage Porthos]DAT68148.1 MAG TPA: hypothetical protein [Herelleviridae sp.]
MANEPTRFSSSGSTGNPKQYMNVSRLEFETKGMDTFVMNRGINILWERAWLCTCRNPMTLAPDSNCPICRGRGIAYQPAVKDIMIIQSQEKGVSNQDLGLFDSGTAIGTTPIDSKITFRDRVTVPDVEIYQSFIFNVNSRRLETGMFLSYDVKRLEDVYGDKGQVLIEGKDFTMDYSTNTFYPKQHLLNTNISINMAVTLRYLVIDLLKESRYQYTKFGVKEPLFENLPRKLLLKREDIFVDSEPFVLEVDTKSRLEALEKEKEITESKMVDPKRTGSSAGGFFGGKLNG